MATVIERELTGCLRKDRAPQEGRKDEGHCTLGPSMTPMGSVLAVLEQDSRWQERLCTFFFSSFQAPGPLLIPQGKVRMARCFPSQLWIPDSSHTLGKGGFMMWARNWVL